MKISITKKNKDISKTVVFLLLSWGIMSRIYSPIMLPGPIKTLIATKEVLCDLSFLNHVVITLKRLAIGLLGAIVLGSVIGIFVGENKKIKNLFDPIFHIIQATPPISWLAMGMIWFGLDGQATVFIVFVSTVPILIINIVEGLENIDSKLIEMARVFNFSKKDRLCAIIFPSLKSYFKSGITIAIGLGWKLVVMGEVLSSNNGIGSEITNARLNIETSKVFAWTILVIILGSISQKLIDRIFDLNSKGLKKYGFGNEQNREKFLRYYGIKRNFLKGQ